MVEKLFICLISGIVCPILLEFSKEVIKRRRDRREKASEHPGETRAPAAAPVSEPPPPPVAPLPLIPLQLPTVSADLPVDTCHPAGTARRTRAWPWILISIISGMVLGPVLVAIACSAGQFCNENNGFLYSLVSIVACAIVVRLLLKIALLPAHGTGVKRVTRIGLRIVVSALIGPSLGIVITLIIVLITGQRTFQTSWFLYPSIVCTITLWVGLNRRGPLRARTGGPSITAGGASS
jgi:hypothetical protein